MLTKFTLKKKDCYIWECVCASLVLLVEYIRLSGSCFNVCGTLRSGEDSIEIKRVCLLIEDTVIYDTSH